MTVDFGLPIKNLLRRIACWFDVHATDATEPDEEYSDVSQWRTLQQWTCDHCGRTFLTYVNGPTREDYP